MTEHVKVFGTKSLAERWLDECCGDEADLYTVDFEHNVGWVLRPTATPEVTTIGGNVQYDAAYLVASLMHTFPGFRDDERDIDGGDLVEHVAYQLDAMPHLKGLRIKDGKLFVVLPETE